MSFIIYLMRLLISSSSNDFFDFFLLYSIAVYKQTSPSAGNFPCPNLFWEWGFLELPIIFETNLYFISSSY